MGRRAQSDLALPLPLPAPRKHWIRAGFNAVALALLFIAAIYLLGRFEEFLINDTRFLLAGPPAPGARPPNVSLEGTSHASEEQILRVFAPDYGRSIYLCPIAERRRRMLAIDWVKEASVSRIWPNRLIVRIQERKPEAFVQLLAADGLYRPGMIDADGVLLESQQIAGLKLPVLLGVSEREPEARRRDRVRLFLRMQAELGPLIGKVADSDVSELEDVKVTHIFEGRILLLHLGNQKFKSRFENFLKYYPEIHKRDPYGIEYDLRVRDRILKLKGVPRVGQ